MSGFGLRYHCGMTGLLEKALRRVESLSPEEQDATASQIVETLDKRGGMGAQFPPSPLRITLLGA